MTTMHQIYGDESDHEVCPDCGMCRDCGDCGCAKDIQIEGIMKIHHKPEEESSICPECNGSGEDRYSRPGMGTCKECGGAGEQR